MNALIETANRLGEQFLHFAWPMFWQSSLFIGVLFALDFALRRRLRASVRYALWLTVFVKLLLPPTLALPTSIAWWADRPAPTKIDSRKITSVTYDQTVPLLVPPAMKTLAPAPPPPAILSPAGSFALISIAIMLLLVLWLTISWWQITRTIRTAAGGSAEMETMVEAAKRCLNLRRTVRLRMTPGAMSPAVCGLLRPTILIPTILAERLSPEQLRAVLLHELVHLRRGDVWINCAQTLLQIAYWWNPLLWLANARIRRVREEAVDDTVMLTLRDEAETYAPTLLEVAKVAISRPLAGLRMVGILESRGALRQRIERLINFRAPRRAGLTLISVFSILAFTALAVPMGAGPARVIGQPSVSQPETNSWPDPHFSGYEDIDLMPQFFITDEARLRAAIPGLMPGDPVAVSPDELANLQQKLEEAGAVTFNGARMLGFQVVSGDHYHMQIGGCTNSMVNYNLEEIAAKTTRVRGANVQFPATQPGWSQLDLFWTPWKEEGTVRSEMKLVLGGNTNAGQRANITIPVGGALVWAVPSQTSPQKYQIVLLAPSPYKSDEARIPIEVEPVVTKFYAVNREKGFENLRKLSGTIESNDLNDQFNKVLTDAGMKSPPANAMFMDSGLVVRGTKAQHHLIYQVILILNEESTQSIESLAAQPAFVETPQTALSLDDNSTDLTVKWFKVDPDVLANNLSKSLGIAVTNVAASLTENSRKLFSKMGVELDPPKSIFYNGHAQVLVLRATAKDLDTIETVIQALDYSPANVPVALQVRNFKFKPDAFFPNLRKQGGVFMTNSVQSETVALLKIFADAGVEIQPPKSLFLNQKGALLVRATPDDLAIIEPIIEKLNCSLPQVYIKCKFIELPETLAIQLLKDYSSVSNTFFIGSFSAVMAPEQVKQLLARCETAPGAKVTGLPDVITASGRQAEVQSVDVMTVVKGIRPEALTPPGITNQMFYQTDEMRLGPIVNLIPRVEADEQTIQLSAVPRITEFLGYDARTNSSMTQVYVNGKKQSVRLANPRPHYRTREMAVSATLHDGQTLLLGGASWAESTTRADGTVDTRPAEDVGQKQLIVLVTPTLIDAEGDRSHGNAQALVTPRTGNRLP